MACCFSFSNILRAPVLLSLFFYFISGCYFYHFPSTHISLMPLEGYVSPDERRLSGFELCISTHEFCINYGGISVARWGYFNTLACFFQLKPILSYITLMSMPLSSHILCLVFIIKTVYICSSKEVTENLMLLE